MEADERISFYFCIYPQIDWTFAAAANPEKQIADIETMLAKGVDGLVILATESAPLTPVAKQAAQAGVLIVNVDRGFLEPVADVFIEGDNKAFGRKSAQFIVDELQRKSGGKGKIIAEAEKTVMAVPGVERVEVKMDAEVPKARGSLDKAEIAGINHIIAVSSGKGGVGKSTVAVNLAVSLGLMGARVGIVMAKSAEGATMFLVPLPEPAIRIDRLLDTIDSSMPGGHAEITIDNLRVPASATLASWTVCVCLRASSWWARSCQIRVGASSSAPRCHRRRWAGAGGRRGRTGPWGGGAGGSACKTPCVQPRQGPARTSRRCRPWCSSGSSPAACMCPVRTSRDSSGRG
mgnify:CR=1 FL=1